jgi:drug/metabolite transporter (DMT)-like permease
MSLGWVLLALSSTIISALVNILDSHFMTQRMPGWRAYVLICDCFTLPVSIVMLFIFPLPPGIGIAPLAAIFASTLASGLASIIILQAMKSQDVARVSPVTSTAPVFVAILAMLFLGETLGWQQWLAVLAVVTGAVLISFKWDARGAGHFHVRPFLMLITAAVLIAISNVTNKYALGYMSFWNDATLIFLISSTLFIAICLRKSVLREIASLKQRRFTIGFALANQAVAIVATVLAYWAVKLGPVALASTIFNSKPLFIFAFSDLAGHFAPGFLLHERGSRKVTLIRATATLAVVGGLIAMLSA